MKQTVEKTENNFGSFLVRPRVSTFKSYRRAITPGMDTPRFRGEVESFYEMSAKQISSGIKYSSH